MGRGGEQPAGKPLWPAAAAQTPHGGAEVVDFVYGLPPDSSTGGCVVQRSFERDLRAAAGVKSVNIHVASDPESAERVFQCLRQQDREDGATGQGAGRGRDGGGPLSRVLIIDGIALLFLRERLHELRHPEGAGGTRTRRVLAGFVHCPFSEPFYREEPWLRAALPEHMLLDENGGGIRAEETRLFALFDRIIAVGAPCRALLTVNHGVSDDAIVVVEPTFHEAAAAPAAAAAAANVPAPAAEFPPRFVSVGTLCPRKGQLALIDALRTTCAAHPEELGGSVLTLIGGDGGDAAYAEAVRAAAAGGAGDCDGDGTRGGGGLRVRLLGSLPHEETLEAVGASDAFLLNSSVESWAVAPVEAAMRGVPVLSTRVGWLGQTLSVESTIWVGSGPADKDHGGQDQEHGSAAAAVACDGGILASSAEWERALLLFASDRRRLRAEARRALPDLTRRYGQAVGRSRAHAVQKLLHTKTEASAHSMKTPAADLLANGGAAPAAVEKERVRKAAVTNALACVFATCVSLSGLGGAAGGLAALVATQVLMLVNLAPPLSPANIVTIFRSLIPPAVVCLRAGSDFGQVALSDVAVFGPLFVGLDMVDGYLARRSKSGPTRVGGALDVESDSIAVLFLSLVASRKAWCGGFIAGVLRYLFVLATGARELPPSPIGPAGRWFAKVAALASVAALAASAGASSPLLCAAGVAVLCASFSVDFFQIWVLLPREAAAKATAAANAAASASAAARLPTIKENCIGSVQRGPDGGVPSQAVAACAGAGGEGVGQDRFWQAARETPHMVAPAHD